MPAIAPFEVIAELEDAVKAGPPERRVRMLRQVASLFFTDADRLDEYQIGLFDEVLVRLIDSVEPWTLTKLSTPLADLRAVPRELTRRLAHHEDPAVAIPILRKCEHLSEEELVEIGKIRSDQHLLALAGRRSLSCDLTDILLTRGDTSICRTIAANPGAQLSRAGFAILVEMSPRDDEIAHSLVHRPDLPPYVLRALVANCTPALRSRLLKSAPVELYDAICAAIDDTAALAEPAKAAPVDYSEARSIVLALNKAGQLNDSSVNRFAVHGEPTKLVVALSVLATIPIETIERLMEKPDGHGLMIACRASRLNWQTAFAILQHRKCGHTLSRDQLAQTREAFEALSLSVAQRSIRFGSAHEWSTLILSPNATATRETH
jgi:uncharacterized protein (DUF2336 family)